MGQCCDIDCNRAREIFSEILFRLKIKAKKIMRNQSVTLIFVTDWLLKVKI